MDKAIGIIQPEHRAYAAVLDCLDNLVRDIKNADIARFRAVLFDARIRSRFRRPLSPPERGSLSIQSVATARSRGCANT